MPEARPILVYDGECAICRYWVKYWRGFTGDRVIFRPYQEAAADFPGIAREAFQRAIQLIEANGTMYSGAAATFRVLRYIPGRGGWWWMYRRVPGFAAGSEWGYAFCARHRGLLHGVSRLLWGPALEPERYDLVSWLCLRLIGAVYLAAFASLAVQIVGLVGHDGILPLAPYLEQVYRDLGSFAYWLLPTLFWLNAGDAALLGATLAGVLLAILVVVGIWTRAALSGLFVLYLSCFYAGQDFMSFQWDLLLLESGFLAIFLTAGSRIVIWLYRWLLFRYLFLAGAAKLVSGDPTWRSLTALDYHFRTQPLPTPVAWYAAQLPHWALAAGTAASLILEVGLVFLIFAPRRLRFALAWCVLLFQFLILLTGNYNFFNLLTMLLCIFLFDDAALRRVAPARLASLALRGVPRPGRWATVIAMVLAFVVVPAGADRIWHRFTRDDLPVAGPLYRAISPFLIVNPYGLFAIMTTTRPEIVIEGSQDGQTWQEYVFRYKPGPLDRRPSWNVPHQPRLDWQMWFAALTTAQGNWWFESLLQKLLQGSPDVLALLAFDPFRGHPPKYVRAQLYEYRFADPATHASTGEWWLRETSGVYFPQVDLAYFGRGALPDALPPPSVAIPARKTRSR